MVDPVQERGHEQEGQPPARAIDRGDIAQLGERGVRNAEVGGSSPPISTILLHLSPNSIAFRAAFLLEASLLSYLESMRTIPLDPSTVSVIPSFMTDVPTTVLTTHGRRYSRETMAQ